MSCQAKASFAACTNSGGTSRRALIARRSRASSCSSSGAPACGPLTACGDAAKSPLSQPSVITLTPRLLDADVPGSAVDDGRQVRRATQPGQASGTFRADAADRYVKGRADFGVRTGRLA